MDDSKRLYVILTGNAASYRAAMRGARKETTDFARDADDAGDATRRLSTELNSMSGRLGIMLDALALVGPGVVPITAMAIPAMSGLANVGFMAAAGLGAAMLAFIGLGDAVKSISEYQLEPSAENFKKMREELGKLPPSAQAFALELNGLLPKLQKVREASASGFFPGALEGLDEVEDMLPRVSRLVTELADSAGDLAADFGEDFTSERSRRFLNFIQREARPAMTGLYDTVGNLLGGMGELWRVMDPANDDFLAWLVSSSEQFDRWAQNLRKTDGAEEFLDYLHDTGPEVAETVGAVADGLLQVVEAAAPMGGVVLDGLQLFGEVIGNIADSPIGPSIFGGLAAVTALNRGLGLTASLMTKAGMTGTDGKAVSASPAGIWGAISAQSTTTARTVSTNVASMRRDLSTITLGRLGDRLTAGATSTRALERQAQATARLREQSTTMAKGVAGGAAALGAMTVMSTEAGRELGITNTAMLGMVGTMLGPWGAAAGAALGTVLDSRTAYSQWADSIDDVNRAIASADFARMYEGLATAKTEAADVEDGITGLGDVFDTIQKDVGATFSGDWNRANTVTEAAEDAEDAVLGMERAVSAVGTALDDSFGKDDLGRNVLVTLSDMDAVVRSAAPAMRDLGYTWEDLAKMDPEGQRKVGDEIRRWIINADSAKGRLNNVGDAIIDLGNDALSTADSADQLRTALEALLMPALDNEAAFDAWRESLKELREELDADAGFTAQNQAARDNRAMTRDYMADTMKRLEAMAGLTETTERDMAKAVAASREEFIKAGVAAGFSREEMVKRAKAMGLTPKLVRTVFEAAGLTETELKARELADLIKRIPPKVQTVIATEGIPKTKEQIDELVEKYGLTEKQRTALVSIRDLASKDIEAVIKLLEETDGKRPNPDVSANTAPARSALSALLAYLNQVDGTTATTYVYTKRRTIAENTPGGTGFGPQPDGRTQMPSGDGRYAVTPSATAPAPAFPGGGTTMTVIRQEAPMIGSVTVPEAAGETDGRAHRAASAIVRETSLAVRSGRWTRGGN